MGETEIRRRMIAEATATWLKAPAHVRTMAGAYIMPLLMAVEAIGKELDKVKRDIERENHAG